MPPGLKAHVLRYQRRMPGKDSPDQLRRVLASQLEAALCMLAEYIEQCPPKR
jgi:hypothetical protein